MSEEPPYEPYFKKPLGYPLFLAFFYVLFGHHFLPVYIAQSILAAVTVVFIFLIAQVLFDRMTAFIAGIVIALNPLIGYFCSTIMTEVSFTFFFVLGIYILMKFRDHGRYVYLYPAMAGLVIGIATTIRPMTQYLPFFFAGVLFTFAFGGSSAFSDCSSATFLPSSTPSAWARSKTSFMDSRVTLWPAAWARK